MTIELTDECLYNVGYKLYLEHGQSAVEEFGEKLGLPFVRCEPCESLEPMVGEGAQRACLVCGTANPEGGETGGR